jgi:uncharacterized membrane protein
MIIKKTENIFTNMDPVHRVIISSFFSLIAFLLIRKHNFDLIITAMILWDVFALTYIITSWIVFSTSTTKHITKKARTDDGGKLFVFFIVVFASFASMITVAILVISKDSLGMKEAVYLPIIIGGILLSWTLVHTTFCFHYAHLYYDNEKGTDNNAEGLTFPNEKQPDYIDFAYFSFIIGMTFQVSDVEISSRKIRRLALLHSLLAFVLNTFVVALTINLIAGLKN